MPLPIARRKMFFVLAGAVLAQPFVVRAKPKVPVVREGEVETISPSPFPWGYQDKFEGKTLFQCNLITISKAVNGASDSTITIAALQKGTIVVTLEDDEWKKRIAMTLGWREGSEFQNVVIHVGDIRVGATGHVLSDKRFLIRPNDRRDFLLSRFFEVEQFSVSVSGLVIKAFSTPKIGVAWDRFRKCGLLKGL
jgi:hypothetical protein